jgi:hypothetical protein
VSTLPARLVWLPWVFLAGLAPGARVGEARKGGTVTRKWKPEELPETRVLALVFMIGVVVFGCVLVLTYAVLGR